MYQQCKKCEGHYHRDKLKKGLCELCHEEHKEATQWWKFKAGAALIVVALVAALCALAYYRVPAAWDCQMRQWEENRETEFTIFRGRCLYVLPDGRRIPIMQSRYQASDSNSDSGDSE